MADADAPAGLVETGHAKLNLALHVRQRRADGYHDIETLFAFCADGDALRAEPADRLSLRMEGAFADALAGEAADDNLVLRAARALTDRYAVRSGASLTLTKRLPVAAGLGGGSADAAAALRLLVRLWRLPAEVGVLEAIGRALGADVPACVRSTSLRGTGRGDELVPAEGLAGVPVLLVNPRVPLATGPVFAGWDGMDRGALGEGDPLRVALAGRNDLEPPALALRPEIGAVLTLLGAQAGVTLARMSGSGATCFALFDEAAARDAAAAAIAEARPDWWGLASVLR